MFGSLEFLIPSGRMAFTLPHYSTLAHSNSPKVVEKKKLVKAYEDAFNWLGPAIRSNASFMEDICVLHTSLKDEDFEFAVRSLGIHYALSVEKRNQRFQRIGETWQAYLTQWVMDTGQSARLLHLVMAGGKT